VSKKEDFKEIKSYIKELTDEEEISNGFPFFALKIYFPHLTDDEIEEALEGLGSNDNGLDAFWVKDQTINFAQFKSVQTDKNLDKEKAKGEWFDFLLAIPSKLEDRNHIQNHKNSRIRDIALEYSTYKNRGFKEKYHLFHLGLASPRIKDCYKASVNYVDFNLIKQKFSEYNSINDLDSHPGKCSISIKEPRETIEFAPTQKFKTLTIVVDGLELVQLMQNHKFSLFNRNVRFGLGTRNRINDGIFKTALEKPEYFFYYNNGITVTCEGFKIKEKLDDQKNIIDLTSPQIINGAQTVTSLYNAYNKLIRDKKLKSDDSIALDNTKKHFLKIKVLCRIIQSTRHDDAAFAESLTRYNNTQNPVKLLDFYSNKTEQRTFQEKFAEFGYFYEIKRGEREQLQKKRKRDLEEEKHLHLDKGSEDFRYWEVKIDIQKLALAYHAFNGKPSEHAEKYIFNSESPETYEKVFGPGQKSFVTKDRVQEMLLAFNVFYKVEEKTKKINKIFRYLNEFQQKKEDHNFKKFLEDLNSIGIFQDTLVQAIKKYSDFNELFQDERGKALLKRIEVCRSMVRCKYLITAVIGHIFTQEASHLKRIYQLEIHLDPEKVDKYIVKPWGYKAMQYIGKAIEKEQGRRSLAAFVLDHKSFNTVIECIDGDVYDQGQELSSIFALNLN
jgi:hypothetical protein